MSNTTDNAFESLRQTCSACPSQWEGRTVDGRYFYARYRFGRLTAGFGSTTDDAVRDSLHGDGLVLGDRLDGEMSTTRMLHELNLTAS